MTQYPEAAAQDRARGELTRNYMQTLRDCRDDNLEEEEECCAPE